MSIQERILEAVEMELDRHRGFLEDTGSNIHSVMLIVKFKNQAVKGVVFQSQCESFYPNP